jgi:hypothetical protein
MMLLEQVSGSLPPLPGEQALPVPLHVYEKVVSARDGGIRFNKAMHSSQISWARASRPALPVNSACSVLRLVVVASDLHGTLVRHIFHGGGLRFRPPMEGCWSGETSP